MAEIGKVHMRPKEAAKYLSVGLSTFWSYVKDGKIKTYKPTNKVTLVKTSDLDSFINGETICATESKGCE